MTELQPLLARNRYTAVEWAYAEAGHCYVVTDPRRGWVAPPVYCGEPSSPDSFYRYCELHDRMARRDSPTTYGT